jgi:hypothetical protein
MREFEVQDVRDLRRRAASLFLAAAGLGAYFSIRPRLPHDHEVMLDFGVAASDITDVELEWTASRTPMDDAAVTTRWHFDAGSAPTRLHTTVRLPDGEWTAEVAVARAGTNETTHWSGRVNLEGSPFWRGDSSKAPVVLSVRQALR